MKKIILLFLLSSFTIIAQTNDPELQKILNEHSALIQDSGLNLIKSGEFQAANQYFSTAINKDESDRTAYFKRGVANWALSDTLNACRDWSAVLALGDTEMFNLLESKCHSTMIIDNDSLSSKQYKRIFSLDEEYQKKAKAVVEVMPSFPGGQENLFKYLSEKTPRLPDGKHGTVYVNFLVSPKGKILYPYVTHGLGGKYDKEAIQVVKKMPAWKPEKQKGKPVYVKSNIPIRF